MVAGHVWRPGFKSQHCNNKNNALMTKKCTGVDRAFFLSQDLLGTLGLKLLMKAHLDALSHLRPMPESQAFLQLPVDFFSAYMLSELSGKVTAESLWSPPGTCAGPRGTCSPVVLWLCTA